jgi:hypothetical protein
MRKALDDKADEEKYDLDIGHVPGATLSMFPSRTHWWRPAALPGESHCRLHGCRLRPGPPNPIRESPLHEPGLLTGAAGMGEGMPMQGRHLGVLVAAAPRATISAAVSENRNRLRSTADTVRIQPMHCWTASRLRQWQRKWSEDDACAVKSNLSRSL